MKSIIALATAGLLAGCSSLSVPCPPPTIKTVEVQVPVLVYPTIEMPSRPALEIDKINPSTSPGETANAYRITVVQLRDYAVSLEALLESFAKPR